jgi:hypothetical protein
MLLRLAPGPEAVPAAIAGAAVSATGVAAGEVVPVVAAAVVDEAASAAIAVNAVTDGERFGDT